MRPGRSVSGKTKGKPESKRCAVDRKGSSTYPERHTREPGFAAISARCVRLLGLVSLTALVAFAPGCHAFDTEREIPKRGSVGEEMYGVLCDRVGAQALREDLTGASFRNVCHKVNGKFSDTVETDLLPPLDPEAYDAKGNIVPMEKQRADRKKATDRIEALARRRADVIRALEATFPETQKVQVKDLDNEDPEKSCQVTKKGGEAKLTDALADMMGRSKDLYTDDVLPQSTQSLGRVTESFMKSEEAQKAWARMSTRQGYRPIKTALGALRPMVSYPNLRDFSNATLRLLSADSQPYEENPQRDADGRRIPVAGPANMALNKLLETAHQELLNVEPDPKLAALTETTDAAGRVILSRPRDNIEMAQKVMFTTDEAFTNGPSNFIVRRDARGYALFRGGQVPAPLVDANGDGLPDVDPLGVFKTADGSVVPTPFSFPRSPQFKRDKFDRAVSGEDLVYEYLDTSKTFAARMMVDMKPLFNPNQEEKHETIMDMMGALPIVMGPRETRTKTFANKAKVEYSGIRTKDSPMLDLVYAMGAVLGDRNGDQTLAMASELFTKEQQKLARVVGGVSAAFDVAQKHPEASIPRNSVLWDDILVSLGKLAQEPGLLEDLLEALADPASAEIGNIYSKYAQFRDMISYDPDDLNGPALNVTTKTKTELHTPVDFSKPRTGDNRSALHRFLGLINDTDHVTTCNKEGAKVHARLLGIGVTMPPVGSYSECQVFKIEEMARFYVDVIAEGWQYDPADKPNKRGTMYLRNDLLRTGIVGIGAATQGLLEESSNIRGFIDTGDDKLLTPTPQWINRLVFFDTVNDSPNEGDKNYRTNRFIRDLNGDKMGTSVCPERVIEDPDPGAPDSHPDKKIRGLRACPDGQWLQDRDRNTIFTWESFGFYRAMKPMLGAFAKHGREDLFVEIATALYRNYPGADATEDECRLANNGKCTRAGANSYEPLIAEALAGDLVPALTELAKALTTLTVTTCEATDAQGRCTASKNTRGLDIAVAAARAALDPNYSRAIGLKDRQGQTTAKRNDGTKVDQVTPAYLLTNALSAVDLAFDKYEEQHPEDKERRSNWRRARSQLVDQFLGTVGIQSNANFANPSIPKMTPVVLEMLRSQLAAHCPRSFTAPFEPCTWAREELVKKAEDVLGGPLATTGIDVMDAVRSDAEGRRQMELMMQYLLDAASDNEALSSVLATANDVLQLIRDDENLLPFYKLLADAVNTTQYDDKGRIVQKSMVDAQMALLSRLSGKFFTKEGKEICANEIDPNQIMTKVLTNLVTPIEDASFNGDTPLEVLIDVIADVNRSDPSETYDGTLKQAEYNSVAQNVVEFLTDKERGLEQLYETVRQCTKGL